MCDDNCANLKRERIRCEPARTINLARHKEQSPYQKVYDTCKAIQPCMPVSEMPVHPICIRVCDKEEFLKRTCKQTVRLIHPPIGHGKIMYAIKAGIVATAVYVTYTQGVWGDQRDSAEALRRWHEYVNSITTRIPPHFDECGKVIVKPSTDSIIMPAYVFYKKVITSLFAGVVKFPAMLRCMYVDYLKSIEHQELADAKQRKIKKATAELEKPRPR